MFYQALINRSKKQPRKIAVAGELRSLTYKQLFNEARQAALYLREFKNGGIDRLIVGIPPSPEFYVLFYAAAAIGMVTIPVSESGKLPAQVKALGPALVAGDKRFIETLGRDGFEIRHAIAWERGVGLSLPSSRGSFTRKKIIRKEPVLGSFTSGSTGEPVLFLRAAEVLFRRAKLGAQAWGVKGNDIMLSTGPFTSGVNAVYHLIVPILCGCSVVVLEKFDRQKTVEALARHHVTLLFTVPLVFDVLGHLPSSYVADFSSLRQCSSVGAHLPAAIYNRFKDKFGIRIGQGYGGTDFAPAFTVNRDGVPDAIGRRHGLFPVKIVDDGGKSLPSAAIGEIVFDIAKVRDRTARAALSRNPKRRGAYVYTGDLGKFDNAGNLYIVGRKSTMIKVGANRVIPAEVENVLRSHPRVREVLVIPVRPGQTDEAVGAIVVRDGRLTAEELNEHCAQRLDSYKCPREISFRRNLPRNRHGKVIRYLFDRA
jgi:acyl-coenzyme A synthetase/AMP-(fatty) acid ligase